MIDRDTVIAIALFCLFAGFVFGVFIACMLAAAARKTPEVQQ